MRKLTQAEITSLIKSGNPGTWNISDYLYLRVQKQSRGSGSGSSSYVFRYQHHGVPKWRSIGPVRKVSLSQAREVCAQWQADIFAGREPGDKPASKVTFEDLLAEALPAMTRRLVLGSAKDFARSLKAASKHFGQKSVQLITVADMVNLESVCLKLLESRQKLPGKSGFLAFKTTVNYNRRCDLNQDLPQAGAQRTQFIIDYQ